jgi:hypothetical protein
LLVEVVVLADRKLMLILNLGFTGFNSWSLFFRMDEII